MDIGNLGQDYFEIRLESIGGLGANLCGKMLGELGVKYLDVNSSSFSSYGSEKTGTPVKGFIRHWTFPCLLGVLLVYFFQYFSYIPFGLCQILFH